MFSKHITVFTLLGLFLLQGCASVYVPSANHIHMMEKKEEVHLAGSFGNNGLNLQGGFSITDYLGFVAAYSAKDFAIFDTEKRKLQYYEGGVSYFRPIGDNSKIEIIAGMGAGTGEAEKYYERFDRGEFTKHFFQVNGALKASMTEAGVSLRFANVNFTEFESSRNIDGLRTESLFFEPAAFVSAGSKNVKLESHLGYTFSLTKPSDLTFDYEFIRLTVGIRFIFNR